MPNTFIRSRWTAKSLHHNSMAAVTLSRVARADVVTRGATAAAIHAVIPLVAIRWAAMEHVAVKIAVAVANCAARKHGVPA